MIPYYIQRMLPKESLKTPLITVGALLFSWFFALVIVPKYKPTIASRINSVRQDLPSVRIDWAPNDDPRTNYNASKVALIIEFEPLPLLVPLILHMIGVVPPDWRFVFMGSRKSVWTVGREFGIQVQQGLGKIDLIQLPHPWAMKTEEDRSRLLTDARFYEEFLPDAEWLLMFNSESIMCANSNLSLNDWLDWTWAGAAVKDEEFAVFGALSLRRVSVIKQILEFQSRYNDSEWEDKFFGRRLEVLSHGQVARSSDIPFSVQNNISSNPMGYHLPGRGSKVDKEVWKYPEVRKAAMEYCPELHIILDMKLEWERCPNDNHMGEIITSTTTTIAPATAT